MTALVLNEFRKLRTVRAPLLLLVVAQLIIVAGVSGLFISTSDPKAESSVTGALAHLTLVSLFTMVVGIMAVAGEYRHRTITDTYLSTPRRGRVVAAKLIAYCATGAAFGLAGAITALVATSVWLAAKGSSLSLSDGAAWRTLAAGILANILFAAIGVAVGALVRNLVGAVAAAFAWIALVEGIVGQLVGSSLAKWLPFAEAGRLGGLNPDSRGAPIWSAGLVLAAYALVFVLVAASTTLRRDVS